MWNKLYLALLGISVIAVGFFVYYSWSWLQSIGDPRAAIAGYEYHSGISSTLLWITTAILLIAANFSFAKFRQPWALWTTFIYFAVFVLIKFFWLSLTASAFRTDKALGHDNSLIGPIFAVFLCAGFGIIVFANHFLAVRIHERIYPSPPADDLPETYDNQTIDDQKDLEEQSGI
ncbi:MAG: hypothetical protein KF685_10665 [Acidobacteria bacterium]|nr:hypothetical protein [Acidobacteriota bacterium]